MIYLAPLQGFTDFLYRKAYANVFQGIDKFFIPYVTIQHSKLIPKYEKEIRSENNLYGNAVPQVLVKDEEEMIYLVSLLKNYGYGEINLNLGCPYPMVTKRGRGAALLNSPRELSKILDSFFLNFSLKLSVKLRAGLDAPGQLEKIIPVLNEFPISEVILHPRIASQLYKGPVYDLAFEYAVANLEHSLVYNGDIFSLADFERRSNQFSDVSDWMLGRGVLKNVFLPAAIKGTSYTNEFKRQKLYEFNELLSESYLQHADNSGNAANKLRQFWIYFSHHFESPQKQFKKIKKAKSPEQLHAEATNIILHANLSE